MDNWHVFQWVDETLGALMDAGSHAVMQNMLSYAQACVIVAVTAYIGLMGASDLLGGSQTEVGGWVRRIVRATVVIALISAAGYSASLAPFLAKDWPAELIAAVSAAGPKQAGAQALDSLLGQSWISLMQQLDNVSGWSFKSAIIGLASVLMFIPSAVAIIAIGFCFFAAKFGLALLVAVGPLFILPLLHPKTSVIFEGWAACCLGLLVELLLLTALLAMILAMNTTLFSKLLGDNGATGQNANDLAGALHWLVGMLVASLLAMGFAWKAGHWAARISAGAAGGIAAVAQGVAAHLAAGAQSAAAAGGRLAGAAGSAINGGGMGGASAAGMRRVVPPGRAP